MKPKLVVLTGAGISAESGIQTFRGADGLWEGVDVTKIASPKGWNENPQLVLDFYNLRRHNVIKAQPNAAHIGLVELEKYFDMNIITQNISDLHERAGSKSVLHLHGQILLKKSVKNEFPHYPYDTDIRLGDFADDGGQFRPHVVWFGEDVPLMGKANEIASKADIFVVIGTSLNVYPAANLINLIPFNCQRFIIDMEIPQLDSQRKFIKIQSTATEGIIKLTELLENYKK